MIEFHAYDLATMLPELFLLGATCVILLVDLFIKPSQRDATHWLTIAALAITGVLVWNRALPDGASLSAFNDMFVLDGMATILKLFILLVTLRSASTGARTFATASSSSASSTCCCCSRASA